MTTDSTHVPGAERPLRLWPGVLFVTLQWLVRFGLPVVAPDAAMYAVLGGLLGGILVLAWWLFFSRAPWSERLGATLLLVVAFVAARPLLHPSVRSGAMGMMFAIYAIPLLSLGLVAWAAFSRTLSTGARWAALLATIVLACSPWALVRSDGIMGTGGAQFAWRWSETPEERLLARAEAEPEPPAPPASPAEPAEPPPAEPAATEAAPDAAPPAEETSDEPDLDEAATAAPAPPPAAEWPGFRGPARDSVIPGVRIATDWAASPPVELWRQAVGPGWSSFAVQGDHVFTQEQRGEDEVVTCYDAPTGQPVWRHRDPVRFWEANAGAGPRATPTLHGGRVFSFGATGVLNALDAADGSFAWSADAGKDAEVEVPYWGFSGSPLVVDDLVIVAAAGRLVAYDRATGERRWLGPDGGGGYSSPHLVTLDGVTQVLLVSSKGATGVDTAEGAALWEHEYPGSAIVQPAVTPDGDLLIGTESGLGRVAVTRGADGWTTEERWSTNRLKPYFNDFVVHEGHAYGFDGRALACVDLAEGERQWKGGRYGHGQLILLADQGLLLAITEDGDLALVEATPGQFTEVARVPAITGKTWNHPVLVDDVLLTRNAEEMAAFRIVLAGS